MNFRFFFRILIFLNGSFMFSVCLFIVSVLFFLNLINGMYCCWICLNFVFWFKLLFFKVVIILELEQKDFVLVVYLFFNIFKYFFCYLLYFLVIQMRVIVSLVVGGVVFFLFCLIFLGVDCFCKMFFKVLIIFCKYLLVCCRMRLIVLVGVGYFVVIV